VYYTYCIKSLKSFSLTRKNRFGDCWHCCWLVIFVRYGGNGEPSAYRCAGEEESRIHCPVWLQTKLIHCRHLVNLQHSVTFTSHAQRSFLRLRLTESVWHHVAVRHSEMPLASESDIGYRFLFLCAGSLFPRSSGKSLCPRKWEWRRDRFSVMLSSAAIEGMVD
jgi:hypothetical protein